jgi:hypothetical protein
LDKSLIAQTLFITPVHLGNVLFPSQLPLGDFLLTGFLGFLLCGFK